MARALPRVRFDIMNTVNKSTGFSPFQLRMSRSPRLIPPLLPTVLQEITADYLDGTPHVLTLLDCISPDFPKSQDNLQQAKILQAYFANKHRGSENAYAI
jgi:hypothetical protein